MCKRNGHRGVRALLILAFFLTPAFTRPVNAQQQGQQTSDLHFNKAVEHHRSGRVREAVEEYKRAIQLRPDLAAAYINLGITYAQLNQLPQAVEAFNQAVKLKPDVWEAHANLGIAYVLSGKSDEALKAYTEALRLKPDLVTAQIGIGVALSRLSRYDEAVEALNRALRQRPNEAAILFQLAITQSPRGSTTSPPSRSVRSPCSNPIHRKLTSTWG